ncbi:MAG TPA: DUF3617 family protein [Vicinamibacterales bacterium]
MKVRSGSVLLLTAALSWTVLAQTQPPIRPGSWQATVKMSMPGMGDMPPTTQTTCVTPAMVKDPAGAVPKGPEGSDCKMDDYKFTGNTATYKMTCTKPAPMTIVGEMKYTGTEAYTGTLAMDMSGQKMTMSFDAKRVGECEAK